MNTETLLDHFTYIANAPNGLGCIRQLILGLAVSGRLVPQSSDDLAVDVMLATIAKEKTKLLTTGEMKADKSTWSKTSTEPPYRIPKSWRWVRLQDIYEISRGGSPRPAGDPRFFGGSIPWITVREVTKDSKKYLTETSSGLTEEGAARSRFIDPGDLLLTNSGATLGVPKISKIKACMNDGVAVLRLFQRRFDFNDYAYLYLSHQTSAFREVNQGMGQPNLNTPIIAGWYFPLPPLEEQQRIVAKVEELIPLCDQLESQLAERAKLLPLLSQTNHDRFVEIPTEENLNAIFHEVGTIDSGHLRQTILSMAVTGRLTQRNVGDSPTNELIQNIRLEHIEKAQKTFPSVSENDVFFSVPTTWQWERLGNLAAMNDSGWSPQCLAIPRTGDEWGVLKVSSVTWDKFQPEENKALPANLEPRPEYEVKDGDLLMSRANTFDLVAKSVVVESPPPHLMMSDKIVRFRFHDPINPRYINLFNLSSWAREYYAANASGTSSSMKNIGRNVMCLLPVPVPPPEEQTRIVEKVTELLHLCDLLESQRQTVAKVAEAFTRSVVAKLGLSEIEEAQMLQPVVKVRSILQANPDSGLDSKQLLTRILRDQAGGAFPSKNVWQLSGLSIAEFYRQLKFEISQGWIIQPDIASVEVVEVV